MFSSSVKQIAEITSVHILKSVDDFSETDGHVGGLEHQRYLFQSTQTGVILSQSQPHHTPHHAREGYITVRISSHFRIN